jgi:DnaK suppressor protein
MPTSKPVKSAKPASAKDAKKVAAGTAAKSVVKPAAKAVPAKSAPAKGVPAKESQKTACFHDKDLQAFRKELMALRDRLTGQVARMRQDSLTRDDEVNTEEDGTDAFERLFALERAGNDQDLIFTIDESLLAIDQGKYGQCEACGSLIEKPRLQALPFAKNCIKCQGEMERNRNLGGGRRQVP